MVNDEWMMVKITLVTMVHGRYNWYNYNKLVNDGYFMVYKPTFTSLGGPILQ